MNWDAIGAIGEVVGALAVVVSLIYVATQIKQNTSATRRQTHQELSDSTLSLNQSISSDPKVAELLTRSKADYDSLSDSEKTQLFFLFINYFNMWDSAHSNRLDGLLGDNGWRVWNQGMTFILSEYGSAREIWNVAKEKQIYNAQFERHVDTVLENIGV